VPFGSFAIGLEKRIHYGRKTIFKRGTDGLIRKYLRTGGMFNRRQISSEISGCGIFQRRKSVRFWNKLNDNIKMQDLKITNNSNNTDIKPVEIRHGCFFCFISNGMHWQNCLML
jgi:hypothetical protein